MKHVNGRLALAGGLLALIGTLTLWGTWGCAPPVTQAQGGSIRYVATTGMDTGDCTDPAYPCATVQYAVDQATAGDEVRVATGVYTDVHQRIGITQTVCISKTVVIRGGYPADFSGPRDPGAHPTTLDAQGRGRVLYIIRAISPTVEGLRITGGNATGLGGTPWVEDGGGGVYLYLSPAIISANIITANTADHGGGLYLRESSATLNGNIITDNVARSYGGGLYLRQSSATLDDNTIITNTALFSGGGMFLNQSAARLSRNTVISNTAINYGGGLWLDYSAATLSSNVIRSNTAWWGGGLVLNYSDATLINDTVVDNQSEFAFGGSGLDIANSSPRLLHTTIARNRGGAGCGIYVRAFMFAGTTVLTNTILVSHTVGVIATTDSKVSLEATLWGTSTWANDTDWAGAGTIITGTRNTWGNPVFVDPAAGDYHIGPGSAAINAGVNTDVTTDMDGDARPDWCFPDLGADEFVTGLGCTRFYLPLVFRGHAP